MLNTQLLCFDYGDVPLLQGVNLSLLPGALLHLRGDNGKGKTTLLRLLAGLILPSSGDVMWQGKSIYTKLSHYQQKLCYVGHRSGLHPALTVRENCLFDWRRQVDEKAVDEALQGFALSHLAEMPCQQLSQGQLHRVSLLRMTFSQASIWLLDEPFVALDEQAVCLLTQHMQAHLDNQGMILLTSHQALPTTFSNHSEYVL